VLYFPENCEHCEAGSSYIQENTVNTDEEILLCVTLDHIFVSEIPATYKRHHIQGKTMGHVCVNNTIRKLPDF